MIQLTAQMRIFVAIDAVDMRNGIDGLAAICRSKLAEDPMAGAVFVFTNRCRTQIRLISYDGQGYWLCTKRLSRGRFPFWPRGFGATFLTSEQLYVLLRGGNPASIKTLSDWRKIS